MDLNTVLSKVESIESSSEEEIESVLREYNRENSQTFNFNPKEEEKRKKLCEGLIRILGKNVQASCQTMCLETLRILSRDKKVLGPVATKQGMLVLAQLAALQGTGESVPEILEDGAHQLRLITAIMRHVLMIKTQTEDKTEELHSHAINLLSNIPVLCLGVMISVQSRGGIEEYSGKNMDVIQVLLDFMVKRIDKGSNFKEGLTPVFSLMTESARHHRDIRKYIKAQVLPPLKDVKNRPEVGTTIRNKLVRLMTHVDTGVKQSAAEFLFVLCKESVDNLLKYTGYGNAAGLLAARGLLAGGRGGGQYSEDEDSDTEEYKSVKPFINPITGHVEEPMPNPIEEMTEEQKEYEALKLVNMFDQLSRQQIIQPMGVKQDGTIAPLAEAISQCNIESCSSDSD
ncbi:synembryn-B-like isoform X2 [Acipenser ruthenus]|uniref:synembryn-B-like isoform X2 n=1 Tax=Acipenser ruthenus TaxID=7906 RepID=UPI0027422A6F|nr:synembryn-B-like isoform X2 [Acipenser ruthenus]